MVKAYYVTMKRGERTAWLAGPYATHSEALEKVQEAKERAITLDAFHDFDAFGTSSLTGMQIATKFGVL